MSNEFIKVETGLSRPPDKVIAEARIAVNVFKSVIEQKPKQVIINGEQYLEYEDWQTLGEFYRCSAVTRDAVPVEVDGVKGAKARADLVNIDTGVIIGGAEAYCLRDEERWSTRPKYEWQGTGKDRKKVKIADEAVPWFQLASMAQTRAGSKAFSNRLRWVAVMAGYRGTPAEEMTGNEVHQQEQTEHFCTIHKVQFFKRGKMTRYAHKDGDGWCNEPEIIEGEAKEVPPAVEKSPAAPEPSQNANPAPEKAKRDPDTIKNTTDLVKACCQDWPGAFKSSKDVSKELGIEGMSMLVINPSDAFRQIAAVRNK